MSKHRRFVVQRKDDGLFWTGENNWSAAASDARKFKSTFDAVTAAVVDYTGPQIAINLVPYKPTEQTR